MNQKTSNPPAINTRITVMCQKSTCFTDVLMAPFVLNPLAQVKLVICPQNV